jgi:hypothetical protein
MAGLHGLAGSHDCAESGAVAIVESVWDAGDANGDWTAVTKVMVGA